MSKGFTLVEVLVAMTIFATIAAAGSAVTVYALRSGEAVDASAETSRRLQLARATMKADFGQALPRPVRDAYGATALFGFTGGGADTTKPVVAFARRGWANPEGAEARGSLQYVEYVLDGETLVRRSRSRVDPTPQTPERDTALLRGVKSLNVSFFSKGVWLNEWRSAPNMATLPEAVAIEVDVADLGTVRQVFMTAARR